MVATWIENYEVDKTWLEVRSLCPNAEHRVPRTCAERKSIVADAQAADTVVVTLQCTDSLTTKSVPDLAFKVIVTSEQKSTRDRECHGCDSADRLANGVALQFSVGADIEKTA